MKKIMNLKNIILTILALVLIVSVVFTFIILKSDYSFDLKFNDEELDFFDEETLHFNDAVSIDFKGSGYTTKLNDDKFNNEITLDEDGVYILDIYKLLKHYAITIEIDSNPNIYLEDNDGKVIHNYLSNIKPFKIVRNSSDINVYVNNMVYTDGTLVEESSNYTVSTSDSDAYIVNILDINN